MEVADNGLENTAAPLPLPRPHLACGTLDEADEADKVVESEDVEVVVTPVRCAAGDELGDSGGGGRRSSRSSSFPAL
jgi:hypothetical protein